MNNTPIKIFFLLYMHQMHCQDDYCRTCHKGSVPFANRHVVAIEKVNKFRVAGISSFIDGVGPYNILALFEAAIR